MFNGQYIKLDTVLNEVSKYPFMEKLSKREAAHKLIDLLGMVGATMPLVRTYANLLIDQHKAALPGGIMWIHGVKNHGKSCDSAGVPMNYATDIYHSQLHSIEAKKACEGETLTDATMNSLYGPKVQGDEKTTGGVLEMSLQAWQVGGNIPRQFEENSYSINGASIDTSFPSGYVTIAYDAVKMDENGFPMVPDFPSFKQAFKYFLLKSFAEPEYYRGSVQKHIYTDIDTQYSWYVGQASSGFKMPSPDKMQAMINGLVRILPRTNDHSDGWKSFNKKEGLGYPRTSPRLTKP